MSANPKLRWWIIATLVVADAALIAVQGLEISLSDLYKPIGFALLLSLLGIIYYYRKEPKFVLVLLVLNHLVLFGWSYMVFIYAGAALNRPLFDDNLVCWDQLLGYHEPDIIKWAHSYATLTLCLNVAYNSLLIQTGIVIAVLGLSEERKPLDLFMLRLMVSAVLAALIFFVCPAVGPFEAYGYPPDEGQLRYMEHFLQLRSGERLTVTASDPEGLITFPSFHTTWAIILALAFRHRRILFPLSALLNGLVIVSTLTSGWHYLSDVLAGILLVTLTVPLSNWLEQRLCRPATVDARAADWSSAPPKSNAG